MSQPIPFPLSKNQLLLAVDKLPYTQRIKYASRLGHDHKANPNLRALVNELLKHPDPPVPEMEAEEGFTELLPSQRTTISKYYNEDQLALNIAAAAGMFDVIKEKINSPSTFFDKLVISNFVTMKEEPMKVDKGKKSAPKYRASDDEVSKAILDAVPARRHILIQESIQEKRLGVIALAVPLLEALPAYPAEKIAHIMHACTSERVRKFIRENKYKNVGQNMKKIIKFHHQDVFDELEEDVKTTNPFQRSYIYDCWRGWINAPLSNNIKNKDIQKRILDIVEKYPPCTWHGFYHEEKKEEPGLYSQDIPLLIKDLIEFFYADFPERTFKLILRTVFVHKRNKQVHGDVDTFWNLGHTSYQHQIQFINFIIAQKEHINDWAKYLFSNAGHVDYRVLVTIVPNAMNTKNWNTHHQQKVLRILIDLYNSTKAAEDKNYQDRWWSAWETLLDNTLSFFDRKFTNARSVLGSSTGKKEQDAKRHEKAKKDIAKYRKAVFGSIDLLYPTILKKSLDNVKHEKDYPLREANINLDLTNRYYAKISSDPVILAASFERTKPHLNTLIERVRTNPPTYPARVSSFLVNILTRVKPARNVEDTSYTKEDKEVADKLFVDIFKYIRSYNEEAFKKDTSLIAQLLGRCDVDLTFEHFFPILAKDPLAYTNFFRGNYGLLSLEQKKAVFKYYNLEAFVHLAQTDYQYLSVLIEPLPLEITNEAVNHLLQTPKAVEESARRVLLPLQDVSDHKIRSSLQKMANANSTAERNEALSALVNCTKRTNNLTQLTRTLTFICEKIKNESHTNRAEILGYLTPGGREFLIPEGVGETQFAKWFEMLDDALQSPSLDEDVYDRTNFDLHPILQHFYKLATQFCIIAAIEDGGKLLNSGLLEFGAEILWKLTVFRHGEKKAAAQYKIPFEGFNFLGTETIQNLVEPLRKVIAAYMKIYEAKITEKNPEWKADFQYYQPFFSISTTYWPFIPEIVDIIHVQVERIKSEAEKDDDGLYIIENDDAILPIVNSITTLPLEHWKQPPAVELIDTLMHSRQAPSILPRWVAWKESGAKLAREFKDAKDKYIDELLKITPSAIHLRFVWRHLLTYDQSKLDNYIGKKKTFRGVFYVDADKRKFIRSALKTPETRRAGGRERSKRGVPARGGRGGARGGRTRATRAGLIYDKPSDIKKSVEEERTKEKEMLEEVEKMPEELRDHEDFFVLEACYGLYRLLPRQVNTLARDWWVQVLNADRSLPYRVKATARWTIMPTITYNDVVVFLNDYENGKEGKTKPLSVNVIETLLRGVMRNDEPCAPLNFLLSPKFLASDRSRVSVYAISQCVPYMPAGGLTDMLKLCLSGKRRYQLKISAYKEIIRLLTSTPSAEHLNMVFREWKREDQHRDVCIAILQNVVKFLTSKNEKFLDISWKILESAPAHEKPEILMAVLGPTPQNRSAMTLPEACLHTKNLGEPYNQTTSLSIPIEHCARFGTKVVIPIAKNAKNDDVQWTALWRLESWNVGDEAIPLLHNYLKDLSPNTLLYSGNMHENNIFTARWQALCDHFVTIAISAIRHEVQPVLDLANTLVNRILELTNKDRDVRIRMLALARHMENRIPETSYLNSLTPEDHKQLRAPFVKLGFKIFHRRSAEIGYRTETLKQSTTKEVLALIHDIIEYHSVHATEANAAVDLVGTTLTKTWNVWREVIPKMVDLQVDVNKSPVSTTPEYLYLLRRVALNAVNKYHDFLISYPMQLLNFWEKLYDFAAERKDIPREHLKCSQIFSHHTLCESVQKLINQCRVHHVRENRIEYMQAGKQILVTIAQRYLSVLKGERGDSFAQVVGDYVIRNYPLFFVENSESDTKWREIAHYVIKTTEDSISILPKMVRALLNNDLSAGVTFIQELLELSLAHRFEKEKPSEEYVRRSRIIGLEAIAVHTPFAYDRIEVTAKFLEQVTPNLPTLDQYAPGDNTVERSHQVTRLVKTACTHTVRDKDVIPKAGKIMIDTYLPKYIDGPKEWEGSAFGPEQRVAREVVYYLISERTNWIVQNYLKFVPNLVNFVMLEATNKLLEKNQAISYITTIAGKHYDKNSIHMTKEVFSLIADVIHMRLSSKPKDKKYVELTFDLVHDLLVQNISFVIKRREDFLHYLNWAISWYVREPDVVELKNNLNTILTSPYLIPVNDDEESIAEVAALIHELIDLKHQKFVLPQQTLLPLQSYPQYTHISLVLALGMTNKFGEKTRLTKEKHYEWREEFILLIDRLSDVKDPVVRLNAWATEIVRAK